MGICKMCSFWKATEDDDDGVCSILHDELIFDVEDPGITVVAVHTFSAFGCVFHEEKNHA